MKKIIYSKFGGPGVLQIAEVPIRKPVIDKITYLAPTGEWCKLPYGPDILIPAYISFIKPVLACFAMAILILDQLSKTTWLKFYCWV